MTQAGGGPIEVLPDSPDVLASRMAGIWGGTSSARGELSRAADAAVGCAEPALSSFDRMHASVNWALSVLSECSQALDAALGRAAVTYATADATAMGGAPSGGSAAAV